MARHDRSATMEAIKQESVVTIMKKQSAAKAWSMLVLSLPKGITGFFAAVVGLSVSLPLSVFLIGLPLLAGTLVLCRRLMVSEARYTDVWLRGSDARAGSAAAQPESAQRRGWLALLSPLREGRSYRGVLHSILQLPVGIAAFTTAIVLPVTAFAVMLSPLAYEVSMRLFDFDLFSEGWALDRLFEDLTSAQRSWIAGGVGAVFVLLMPIILKLLGRCYASWTQYVAGFDTRPHPEEPYVGGGIAPMAEEARQLRLHASSAGKR